MGASTTTLPGLFTCIQTHHVAFVRPLRWARWYDRSASFVPRFRFVRPHPSHRSHPIASFLTSSFRRVRHVRVEGGSRAFREHVRSSDFFCQRIDVRILRPESLHASFHWSTFFGPPSCADTARCSSSIQKLHVRTGTCQSTCCAESCPTCTDHHGFRPCASFLRRVHVIPLCARPRPALPSHVRFFLSTSTSAWHVVRDASRRRAHRHLASRATCRIRRMRCRLPWWIARGAFDRRFA